LAFGALVLAVLTFLIWFGVNARIGVPQDRTPFVLAFLCAAGLGLLAMLKSRNWLGRVVPLPAILIGLFLPFTVAISPQAVGADSISVGDPLPRFTAIEDTGDLFDSETLRGKPVLIKFFRAHW